MMISRNALWAITASLPLFLPATAIADSTIADLDKQKRDQEEQKAVRPEMGEGEHEDYHRRLAEEGEKTLDEINKLLDEIQKNLASKETGAATQGRQKEVVERLEKLIQELGKG